MAYDAGTTTPPHAVPQRWGMRGRLSAIAAAAVTLAASVGMTPIAASAAVSSDAQIVIGEVYGGGGNSGATLTTDFVELVNRGTTPVDLSTWSLQYASATGTTWNVDTLAGTINPGATFLVSQARGAGGTTELPTPDDSGSLTLSGTAGKIALVSSVAKLASTSPTEASVVDYVAWGGAATPFVGSGPAPATTNATSISRSIGADGKVKNTPDNGADFVAGAPTPTSTNASSGGGTEPEPEPENPDPSTPPQPETPTVTTIAEIQGTGSATAFDGKTVTTEGVVTARYATGGLDGYVIQTAGTGGELPADHAASDAIFVYAPGTLADAVAIGDSIRITAEADEFNGLTQLRAAANSVTKIAALAAPTPATVAWPTDETAREALESMLIQPQGDITVTETYATNQYGEVGLALGDLPLRQPTDAAAPGSAEAAAIAADNARRALTLDDGTTTNFLNAANSKLTPAYVSNVEPIRVGAKVRFDAGHIVDYRFDEWRLQPTAPLVANGDGVDGVTFENTRTAAPEAVGGDLSVASFNVLNYFTTLGTDSSTCRAFTSPNDGPVTVSGGCPQRGAWDAEDFQRQQTKIVDAINGLDASVVGLMEIENSAALGEETDEALASLVAALNADAGEARWSFVPSSSDLPPASERDVITNAIIFQPALVSPVGDSRALGTQSGSGQAFDNAREPIAQTFAPKDGGEPFFFVVNHFKSKGSVGPWPGDVDKKDGQGTSNESRTRQATALAEWVPTVQGDAKAVVMVGDYNSYAQEDPMRVLYGAGYTNAEDSFGLTERSYSFQGLSGSLDHVLLNDAALARATGTDIWGINSGEALALEYSRYRYSGTDFYRPDPYRSSDHDPVKVGLTSATPPVDVTLLGINDFHGRIDSNTVNFAGTIEQQRAAADGPVLFLSSGDNIGASLFASSIQKDQPTLDVLNALGLQASAVGNHEFDQGFADLTDRVIPASKFPFLGANVYAKGTTDPALGEYTILDADGVSVGVVGVVTEETGALVSPDRIAGIEFGDPVEALNRVSDQLSDGDPANGEADVIVALVHDGAGAGTPEKATLEQEVAAGGTFADVVTKTSANVDAIFTGHTHKQYAWSAPIPGTDRTRPIVQTGSYGERVGKIVLSVNPATGDVTAHTESNVERTATPAADLVAAYPRVAEVKTIVGAALANAATIGNTAVAEVSGDITTAFAGGSFVNGIWTGGTRDDRSKESALGNLVADSLLDTLDDLPNGADIGVMNPGGLRGELWDTQAEFGASAAPGLRDGQISFAQANAVLPFNNTLGIVTLTGAQFDTLLEQQWQRTAAGAVPSRPYLQLGLSDNVSYTFDESQPEGQRVTSITVDGKPIDPTAEYRIGSATFLLAGGDNFRVLAEGTDRVDTGLLDYVAWIDYLKAGSPIGPDFGKQAVSVTGLPATPVVAGTDVSFDVAQLDMTSRGTPQSTSIEVRLGDRVLATVPVSAGAAKVTARIPAETPTSAITLVLTTDAAETQLSVPVQVQAAAPAVTSKTSAFAVPPLQLFGLVKPRIITAVSQSSGSVGGTVLVRLNGQVVGQTKVDRSGVAIVTVPRVGRGTHSYTAEYVPAGKTVKGSTSNTTSVRVLF